MPKEPGIVPFSFGSPQECEVCRCDALLPREVRALFSINLSLVSYTGLSVGLSVTGVGIIGPAGQPMPRTADELVVPWHDAQANPTVHSLLSWHTRLSGFAGRDQELMALRAWAESDPTISIKFITGSGGVGKSRLAAEFAAALRGAGWSAGFISLRKPRAFAMKALGTLLVIDYPEEYPDGVREFLADLAELGPGQRIRVLFLTRRGIDNWAEVISDSHAIGLVDMKPVQLGILDDRAAYELFCSAQERAAELLHSTPLPASKEDFAAWLWREPENYRALFVVAAALQSAVDPNANAFGYRGAEVMGALGEWEISRLRRIARVGSTRIPDALARVVAVATIAGSLKIDQIGDLTKDRTFDFGFASGVDIGHELNKTMLLEEGAIEAMQPDILGASFVLRVLSKDPDNAPDMNGMKISRKSW